MIKESYKNGVLKLMSVAAVASSLGIVCYLGEERNKVNREHALQKATVIARHQLLADDAGVTRLYLDMDGNHKDAEAICEIEGAPDVFCEKLFPNGTTRSVYEWDKLGRFFMKKTTKAL